jgi:hypothetical protein
LALVTLVGMMDPVVMDSMGPRMVMAELDMETMVLLRLPISYSPILVQEQAPAVYRLIPRTRLLGCNSKHGRMSHCLNWQEGHPPRYLRSNESGTRAD